MSGELEMFIKATKNFFGVNSIRRLKESINKIENMTHQVDNQKIELENLMSEFQERDRQDFKKKKEIRKKAIENLINEYYNIMDKKNENEFKNELNIIYESEDIVEIIKVFAKIKTKLISSINDKIEEMENLKYEQELFGIIKEEDLKDEKKMSLYTMYKEMKNMGYNPIFDSDNNKILVLKENGDQIETINKEGKIKMSFHDYNGKNCSKDMAKIEQGLRKNNLINKDERIYTHWYNNEKKESNKKLVLENNKIYEEYQKNNHKTNPSFMKFCKK